ncbi:unnamed protein product [Nyctereutes procyonoides]|uniref:(raccoon dog) hypothetical protein n=1 Tax=Nyctereutes procyonoides TaxID=34880 RepID=A0A811ZHD1_NYCPR|nr:unnamed protein product [Nyctereutes procyonoides]CAD7688207.1 unnamed protein product [Nyctereutes procyonoides]
MLPCDPGLQKVTSQKVIKTGGYNPENPAAPARRDLVAPPEVNVAAPGCGSLGVTAWGLGADATNRIQIRQQRASRATPQSPGNVLLRVKTTACGTSGGRRASCTFEQSDRSDGWRLPVFRHTGPKKNPDFSDGPLQRAQTRTPPHALAGVRARPQGPSEVWLAMCQTTASAGRRPRHVPAEPRAGPTPKQYGGQQGTAQDILCMRWQTQL